MRLRMQQDGLFFMKMQQGRLFFTWKYNKVGCSSWKCNRTGFFMKMQLGVNCDVLIYFKQQNVLFFTENAKECAVFHWKCNRMCCFSWKMKQGGLFFMKMQQGRLLLMQEGGLPSAEMQHGELICFSWRWVKTQQIWFLLWKRNRSGSLCENTTDLVPFCENATVLAVRENASAGYQYKIQFLFLFWGDMAVLENGYRKT